MTRIIEFSGTVLTAPETEHSGLWSVDGLLTFRRPAAAPEFVLDGWVIPGLVDAHCHIGLGPPRAGTSRRTWRSGRLLDRPRCRNAAGPRCRKPSTTPAGSKQRADLPRLIRSGRHIARTRRYLRGFAVEVEPEDLVEAVRKPGPCRGRLGQARGGLDRPGRRRPRRELPGPRTLKDAARRRPRRRRPRHGALLRRRHPG